MRVRAHSPANDPAVEGRAAYWGGFRPLACRYAGADRRAWMDAYNAARRHYEAHLTDLTLLDGPGSRVRPRVLIALRARPMTLADLSQLLGVAQEAIRVQVRVLMGQMAVRCIGERRSPAQRVAKLYGVTQEFSGWLMT